MVFSAHAQALSVGVAELLGMRGMIAILLEPRSGYGFLFSVLGRSRRELIGRRRADEPRRVSWINRVVGRTNRNAVSRFGEGMGVDQRRGTRSVTSTCCECERPDEWVTRCRRW